MQRVHDECGEMGEIRLAHHPVVMLYGEKAQRAFQEGKSSILFPINAQQAYVKTRLGYLQSLRDYQQAITDLEQAIGGGL